MLATGPSLEERRATIAPSLQQLLHQPQTKAKAIFFEVQIYWMTQEAQ